MPVMVVRTETDNTVAFENRCLRCGALICLDSARNAKNFTCVDHAWRYDLSGNPKSIACSPGANGRGGMADSVGSGQALCGRRFKPASCMTFRSIAEIYELQALP